MCSILAIFLNCGKKIAVVSTVNYLHFSLLEFSIESCTAEIQDKTNIKFECSEIYLGKNPDQML